MVRFAQATHQHIKNPLPCAYSFAIKVRYRTGLTKHSPDEGQVPEQSDRSSCQGEQDEIKKKAGKERTERSIAEKNSKA